MQNKFFILIFFLFSVFIVFEPNTNGQTNPDSLLLNNYRPVSIYNIPQTLIKKAKYPVIDMHSHSYVNSEKELDERVRNMDSCGIRVTIILTCAYGRKFDSLATFFSKYPGRFILFCGFDYEGYNKPGYGPAAVKELERCYAKGARGVGELGDKGKGLYFCTPPAWGMHIDDPRLDGLLNKCAELGMPVSIHVGEPEWFYEHMDSTNDGLMNAYNWRLDNQKGILNLNQELKKFAHAVEKHPKTIFIACHFANQVTDLSKLGRLFDKYSNLYADIGARYAEISAIPRYAKSFMEKYNNRLFYGTDMGFSRSMYEITFRILETSDEHFYEINLFNYHWPLYGLGLSNKTLKKLYWSNAVKILKLKINL
ncbi:MAG: amidohydrolase family protein [Ignavibacteriaceae bacterium]